MSPRQTNTRSIILDHARGLLQTRGVDGFSYRDIATPLGVKNAAIHYHFPTKNDLLLALIERFTAEVRDDIRFAQETEMPIPLQLETYFKRAVDEVDEGGVICPMGALVIGYEGFPEQVREALESLSMMVHRWLVATLERGRTEGVIHFDGEACDKALEITAAVTGARQISRIRGCNCVAIVARQLRIDLGLGTQTVN